MENNVVSKEIIFPGGSHRGVEKTLAYCRGLKKITNTILGFLFIIMV